MVKRLAELYEREELVEVKFREHHWFPARVIGFQHPGVWVTTADGAQWYVTNGRRIRKILQKGDVSP